MELPFPIRPFLIVPLLVLFLRGTSFPLPVLPSSGEPQKTRAEASGPRHLGNTAIRAQVRLSFPEGVVNTSFISTAPLRDCREERSNRIFLCPTE